MVNHQEIELKLQVLEADQWLEILQWEVFRDADIPGSAKQECLEARYYDTVDGKLRQAGLAYRIRRENEKWVATIKGGGSSEGGLHSRLEVNELVDGPEPDLSVFSGHDLVQQALIPDPLYALLITRFTRSVLVINSHGSIIEVAADRGEIIAGDKQAPILEIELELKSGNAAELLLAGAKLAERFALVLEPCSKFARGLMLAGQAVSEQQVRSDDRVIGHIYRLLGLLHTQWESGLNDPSSQHAILLKLQQSIVVSEVYAGFQHNITDWMYALEQNRPPDFKQTIPLLLKIWAAALQAAAS
ncbi:CYTH domain-containing protein [bacterium BFN5]|nr:CYTH domain-containing protein [bacterium BFN5]